MPGTKENTKSVNKPRRAQSAPVSRKREVDFFLAKAREKEQSEEINERSSKKDTKCGKENGSSHAKVSSKSGRKRSTAEMRVVRRSRKLRKDFHEDIEWPPDSPSAQVYDVSNSSAKLVILNNQHKESRRLRGYDNHPRPPSGNPDRHVAPNYPVKNHERHTACTDSSTPVYKPGTDLKDMWINSTARPAITPERKRHEGCQLPTHPYYTSLEHAKPKKPGGVKAVMRKPPINVQSNPNLIHPGMSEGHKRCMYFIAQAYDMSNMKRLKQLAYRDLLMRQQYLGFHKESQYIKYMKYLEGPRKKQFGDKESLFKRGQRPSSNRPESAPPMPLTSDRTTPRDTSPKSTPRAVKLGPLPPRRRPKSSIPRASSAPGKQSREKPFLQKITEDDLHSSPISVRKNAFEEEASTEGSPRQDDREAMDSADEMAPSESSRSSRSSRSSVSSKSSRSSKSSTVKAKSNSSAKSSKSGADEESKPLPNQTCDSQDKVDTKEGESDGEEREGKLSVRTTSTTTSMTSFETKTETEDYVPESSSRFESDTKTVTESGWSRGRQDTTKDDYGRLQEVEEEEVPTKEEQPEQGTGVDFIKSAKIDQDETLVKEIEKETFEGVDDKPNVEKQEGLKEDKSGDRTEATADVPKQSDEETPKFETEQREEDQKASKRSDTESTDTESLSTGTESASSNNETKPTETEHVKAEDEEKPTEPAETENTNLQELKQKSLTVYFREDLTPAKDLGEPAETQKQDSEHIVDDAEEEAKDEEEKQQQELYDVEEEKRAPPSVSGAASSSLSKSDDDDDVMASETQAVSTTTYATEHAQTTRREDEADPRLDYPESDTQPIETITQEDGEVVAFIESSAIDKDDTLVKEVEQEVFEASTEAQVRGGAEHETQAESKQTTGDEMPITQTQAVNETQPRATEELDVPTTEDHLHKGSVNENETPVSQTQPESETEPAVNDKPLREVESDSESSSSSRSNASDSGSQTTQEDAPKLVDTTDMGDANEQAAFDEDNDVLETASVSSSSGWEDDDELKKSREGKDRPRTRLGNRPMPTPEADQSTSKANGETQDQHEAALESEEAKDEGNQATDTRSQATKQEEFYEQAQRMRFKRTDVTLVSAQTSGEQGSGHTEDKKESEAMKSVEEVEIVHDVTQIEENPDIEIDPAEVPQYPRLC